MHRVIRPVVAVGRKKEVWIFSAKERLDTSALSTGRNQYGLILIGFTN